MTALLPALAGANLIYGLGMLDSGITISHSQLLIDCELAGFVRRALRGVPVNETTEAVELIKKIGPRGQFLTQKHTRQYMRDNFDPMLCDRQTRRNWVKRGSQSIGQVAEDRTRHIIETYKPQPLSDKILAELDALIRKAEIELRP